MDVALRRRQVLGAGRQRRDEIVEVVSAVGGLERVIRLSLG